ncbi:hypothetical protein QQZ08_006170 [Neonectria magnoliae]|uniref:Uncharacterized protein n=1 Tax=Neonectria magnoliae TaxID=2732573 RepID=A0ABR1I2F1_9HYPO
MSNQQNLNTRPPSARRAAARPRDRNYDLRSPAPVPVPVARSQRAPIGTRRAAEENAALCTLSSLTNSYMLTSFSFGGKRPACVVQPGQMANKIYQQANRAERLVKAAAAAKPAADDDDDEDDGKSVAVTAD